MICASGVEGRGRTASSARSRPGVGSFRASRRSRHNREAVPHSGAWFRRSHGPMPRNSICARPGAHQRVESDCQGWASAHSDPARPDMCAAGLMKQTRGSATALGVVAIECRAEKNVARPFYCLPADQGTSHGRLRGIPTLVVRGDLSGSWSVTRRRRIRPEPASSAASGDDLVPRGAVGCRPPLSFARSDPPRAATEKTSAPLPCQRARSSVCL